MCNVQFKTKIAKLTYQIYIQNIYYQISRKFSNFSIFDRLSIFKSWRHFDSKKSFYILNAGIVRENVEYLVSICILVCTKQNIYKKTIFFVPPNSEISGYMTIFHGNFCKGTHEMISLVFFVYKLSLDDKLMTF